jgi:hypothetical protein
MFSVKVKVLEATTYDLFVRQPCLCWSWRKTWVPTGAYARALIRVSARRGSAAGKSVSSADWYYDFVMIAEQTYQTARLALVQAPIVRLSESAALFQALGSDRWKREDVTAVARTVLASNSPE